MKKIHLRLFLICFVVLFFASFSLEAFFHGSYYYDGGYFMEEEEEEEEVYVNQYCSEEEMKLFDEFLTCTDKFIKLKWGAGVLRAEGFEDYFVPNSFYSGYNSRTDGRAFAPNASWAADDPLYLEYLDKGVLVLADEEIRSLSCWNSGWGDGSDAFSFRKAKATSHSYWDKYYQSPFRSFENQFDAILMHNIIGAALSPINRKYYKAAKRRDVGCGRFVSFCRTGEPLYKGKEVDEIPLEEGVNAFNIVFHDHSRLREDAFSAVDHDLMRSHIKQYTDDGIEVLHSVWYEDYYPQISHLIVNKEDCLRYYRETEEKKEVLEEDRGSPTTKVDIVNK